jgi:hypothetical protein
MKNTLAKIFDQAKKSWDYFWSIAFLGGDGSSETQYKKRLFDESDSMQIGSMAYQRDHDDI